MRRAIIRTSNNEVPPRTVEGAPPHRLDSSGAQLSCKEEIMRSVLGLVLVVVLSIAVSAQLPTATLNGTVTDPQGAVVEGAKVSIVSQATGAVRDTTTDTAGFYSVTDLLPADYTIRVETPTFAKAEIQDVRLDVGRASTVDVKLAIATVGQSVTVQTEEVEVNLTQSEVQ